MSNKSEIVLSGATASSVAKHLLVYAEGLALEISKLWIHNVVVHDYENPFRVIIQNQEEKKTKHYNEVMSLIDNLTLAERVVFYPKK